MNVLSLFSGVGGLELGLERAGMSVVGQVELDPYCRRVLARHWPEVPRHDDVRTAARWWGKRPRPPVHVVAGGFPCQPFSSAVAYGRKRGVGDPRWGWPWMHDVVRAVQPDWVIVENVPDLTSDGEAFGWILGDLADLGFDAEWAMLSACAVGAPHTRQRLFLVAHTRGVAGEVGLAHGLPADAPLRPALVDAGRDGREPGGWWSVEPAVGRVADGIPHRLDRLRALGNAVVPAVSEHIGQLITSAAAQREVAA